MLTLGYIKVFPKQFGWEESTGRVHKEEAIVKQMFCSCLGIGEFSNGTGKGT